MLTIKTGSTAEYTSDVTVPLLYLIGTVHNDPYGYDTLYSLLNKLNPEVITIELSPYGRGFRTKHSKKLSEKLIALYNKCSMQRMKNNGAIDYIPTAIQELLSTVRYPFEYSAARDYSISQKITLYCIDLSSISRKRLLVLKNEAIEKGNIAMLLAREDKSVQESVDLCYKRAAVRWNKTSGASEGVGAMSSAPDERELHMSRRIANLLKKHPRKTIVHIGGWEHLAGETGRNNLYHLLKKYSPQRILLSNGK